MMEGPRHQHLHQEWQEPLEEPGDQLRAAMRRAATHRAMAVRGGGVAALELDLRLPGRPDASLLGSLLDGLSAGLDDGTDVDAGSLELWEALVLRKTLLRGTGVSAVGTGGGVTGRRPLVEALQVGASRVLGAGPLLAPRARCSPHGRQQLLGGRR